MTAIHDDSYQAWRKMPDGVWRVQPDDDQPGETWADAYARVRAKVNAHNDAMINLCESHLDDPGPSPGCHLCTIDELRTRLVETHEGGAAQVDAVTWERRCGTLEDQVRELGGDPFRGDK